MKRFALFISFILCYSLLLIAQKSNLAIANELYTQGKYSEAAKQYESVVVGQGVAPELYYNIGNSYFKANELGLSILNYERALRLRPGFEDARVNLELAQLKVIDNIVQSPTFFLGRWIISFIKIFSSNVWFVLSVSFFVLCLVFIFLFVFGNTRSIRKSSFYFSSVFLCLFLISLFFAGIRKEQMTNHNYAIVMTGIVTVKSSPDQSGTDLFQLHEGTKVKVQSTLGKWVEIKLGNGSVGWVEDGNIERI